MAAYPHTAVIFNLLTFKEVKLSLWPADLRCGPVGDAEPEGTGPGLTATAGTAAQGRGGMDTVLSDTRAGVAALAPSTDTPAGKHQLVEHLQALGR